ncbi:MAG: sigma 54-interacting transcriptional regulator, partial [Deltaproteobacteria bacterium]|nr:sigma 54-interacting transcriptional regulator [Deltaproteobacteria bacterium]
MRQIFTEKKLSGITAVDIAEKFKIFRTNASAILNQLVKKGSLIKVESRPVYFLPTEALPRRAGCPYPSQLSAKDFFETINLDIALVREDPFDLLIGACCSLANQVEQGKSAVLYPPNGLHTLIIGESGTGKTLFARTMHEYGARVKGKTKSEYPYVTLNCSDYSHNPQLLMSHLFGHVKGAFTGAEKETKGIVENADGGILFLDEIHRLPPEGQELLFYLMDKGCYRKLGESGHTRQASVLIVVATTEDPNAVLLKTFIRRIPLTITLPPFREKPLDERIKLIEHIFMLESTATSKNLVIGADVVKALAVYDFPGNVGQLASEVKVLCARTFLNNGGSHGELSVGLDHISAPIRANYFKTRPKDNRFRDSYDSDIRLTPSRDVQYLLRNSLAWEHGYKNLLKNTSILMDKGLSHEEISEALASQIRKYCGDIVHDSGSGKINKEAIYKVVDPKVVDFTIEVMGEVFENLSLDISQRDILIMAFHVQHLLERLKTSKAVSKTEISQVEKEYGQEMKAASRIVKRIEGHFGLTVPKDEKYLIAILLANLNPQRYHDRPALFVIAHGQSTASSIASVSNQLMDCDYVRAIDVPLWQNVQVTYRILLEEAQRVGNEKGIILAVDMGSLTRFGEMLTRDTGLPTRTIPNVTTLMVLELTRVMMGKLDDINAICDAWIQRSQEPSLASAKQEVILTMCASGVGTSEAFKTMLEQELSANGLSDIQIMALNFNDIVARSAKYRYILENYNVLACVGNIECEMTVPFTHISELIDRQDMERFIKRM